MNSLCGLKTGSTVQEKQENHDIDIFCLPTPHMRQNLPVRTFCVTVNVLPVSNGTIQLTGSGERINICSGDLTRVGSGGDLTMCS